MLVLVDVTVVKVFGRFTSAARCGPSVVMMQLRMLLFVAVVTVVIICCVNNKFRSRQGRRRLQSLE